MSSLPTPSVDQVMQQLFCKPRAPRSAEYKAGVRSALEAAAQKKTMPFPYEIGTAQADAFIAGEAEGRTAWFALSVVDA